MTSLRQTLLNARKSGRSAFIPFVMAGDPDMAACEEIIIGLQAAGADLLELGIPFSDPAADGVTVQRAAERALARGTTLESALDLLPRLRAKGVTMPICLFSYLNPVYRMGYETFINKSQAAGANGALLVDLPPEEAAEYCAAAAKWGFETVFLCSPTTSAGRLKMVDECSSGFVYYVSREGVTGAQKSLPATLEEKLRHLRQSLKNPVAVGFGISAPEHVRQLNAQADGIVVGSALVKIVEENPQTAAAAIMQKARALKAGLPAASAPTA